MIEVTLLDYTGIGFADPADQAAKLLIYAKNTRLTQGEDLRNKIWSMPAEQIKQELHAIEMSVRSSWEFVHYMWQITGVTRAFTHQFVRSRHGSFAQQSMRVANMEHFEATTPATVKGTKAEDTWDRAIEVQRQAYCEMRANGIPAGDARGILPTNVNTSIIAGFNLRAFAELVGKRLNARAQDEYVEVIRKMANCVLEVHPWAAEFLFPPRLQTPALDVILKTALAGRASLEAPGVNDALKEIDRLKGVWG